VRQSLDAALGDLFLLGAGVELAGLAVVLFLREDPLHATHRTREPQEMLVAEAEAGASGGLSPEGSAAEGGLEPVITCTPDDDAAGLP